MRKLNCKDAGFACDGVLTGQTDDEVMTKAAEHVRDKHNMQTIDDATRKKIRGQIKNA